MSNQLYNNYLTKNKVNNDHNYEHTFYVLRHELCFLLANIYIDTVYNIQVLSGL